MKGILLKDLHIAKSNILVTVVSLIVLGFGLSFLLETSALLVLAPLRLPQQFSLLAFNLVLMVAALWFFTAYKAAVRIYQKRDLS